MEVMRKVFPAVTTKETAELVAPVPDDFTSVIAVSTPVAPEATPVA
jgi:hypothetical protein